MKRLALLGSYKRDLKRIVRRGWSLERLEIVVTALRLGEPLSLSAHPHKLAGGWLDFWECHITGDWLLIYDVTDTVVLLAGNGTHADLFE